MVVEPISSNKVRPRGTSRPTHAASASQLAAASCSGSTRAASGETNRPSVDQRASGAPFAALSIDATMDETPSALVGKQSANSPVMVAAIESNGSRRAIRPFRRSVSPAGSRHRAKGSAMALPEVVAALRFAPPMSSPSTSGSPKCSRSFTVGASSDADAETRTSEPR